MDHFEVFGLPRRLRIDGAELQRKFYELSRRYHPDFHQAAPAERQAENDVPQPQVDFACGLTKVNPPVSPCCT